MAEIIVADNASTDDSIAYLNKNHPDVEIFSFDKNYGFAEGYNIAIGRVKTEYVLILNSDVEVTPGFLEPMVEYMDANPKVAACQPKILQEADRTHFEKAGAAGGMIDVLGYPFCRGRIMNYTEKDNGQYDNICNIFWASGACMLVRRDDFIDYEEDTSANCYKCPYEDICRKCFYGGYYPISDNQNLCWNKESKTFSINDEEGDNHELISEE